MQGKIDVEPSPHVYLRHNLLLCRHGNVGFALIQQVPRLSIHADVLRLRDKRYEIENTLFEVPVAGTMGIQTVTLTQYAHSGMARPGTQVEKARVVLWRGVVEDRDTATCLE